MIALFFEVLPKPGHEDHYFQTAAKLKSALDQHDGMLWLDRYRSLADTTKILSHQLWRDEDAIDGWRNDPLHLGAQNAGRNVHFADYRIRISPVLATIEQGEEIQTHPLSGHGDFNVVLHRSGQPPNEQGESFKSINVPGSFVTLAPVKDLQSGLLFLENSVRESDCQSGYLTRNMRDYGMFEREQAPAP